MGVVLWSRVDHGRLAASLWMTAGPGGAACFRGKSHRSVPYVGQAMKRALRPGAHRRVSGVEKCTIFDSVSSACVRTCGCTVDAYTCTAPCSKSD